MCKLAESALSGEAGSKAETFGMDKLMDFFKPGRGCKDEDDEDDN